MWGSHEALAVVCALLVNQRMETQQHFPAAEARLPQGAVKTRKRLGRDGGVEHGEFSSQKMP